MGIFSALIGNLQERYLGTINKAVRATLIDGEEIELGFKLESFIFTTKRLI
jgi:hypothetical protein